MAISSKKNFQSLPIEQQKEINIKAGKLIYERLKISPEKLSEFCKQNNIIELGLFGSILTDKFYPSSDIDLLVTFDENKMPNLLEFFQLEEYFKNLFNRVKKKANL